MTKEEQNLKFELELAEALERLKESPLRKFQEVKEVN